MPRWARLLQRSSRWYLDKDVPSRETATDKPRKPPEPQPGVSGLHAAAAPQNKAHCRCRAQVIGSYARLIAALSWVPLKRRTRASWSMLADGVCVLVTLSRMLGTSANCRRHICFRSPYRTSRVFL